MKQENRWRCAICGKYISNYDHEDICEKCKPIAMKESEEDKK